MRSVSADELAKFLHEEQPVMLGGRSQPLSVYIEFARLILSQYDVRLPVCAPELPLQEGGRTQDQK